MSRGTMHNLGFGVWVQVIRLLVIAGLYAIVSSLNVETPASHLDQTWMKDLCLLLMGFFIFINLVFIIPIVADAPHVIFLVIRVFFGVLLSLYHHIVTGFTLYSALTE